MAYTKIGLHCIDGNDKGEIGGYNREAAPTMVMLVNAFDGAAQIVALPHKPLVIGRVSRDDAKPEDQILKIPPSQCAWWYFGNFLDAQINNNSAITHWVTINEPVLYTEENNHALAIERMKWVDEYQSICDEMLAARGKRLVAFNFSVGNPFGRDIWIHAKRTLELTKTRGVIIGLHRYLELVRLPDGGIDYQTTVNGFWGTYHEGDIAHFSKMGYMPRIAITECGLENVGAGRPWKTEGITAREYATIMHLWGKRLELYQQVIGATVFTVGGAGWEPYDVANTPFISELQKFAQVTPPPKRLTNQQVFNAIGRLFFGRPVGKCIPYDTMLNMIRDGREAEYRGGNPLAWGLSDAQRAQLAKELGL